MNVSGETAVNQRLQSGTNATLLQSHYFRLSVVTAITMYRKARHAWWAALLSNVDQPLRRRASATDRRLVTEKPTVRRPNDTRGAELQRFLLQAHTSPVASESVSTLFPPIGLIYPVLGADAHWSSPAAKEKWRLPTSTSRLWQKRDTPSKSADPPANETSRRRMMLHAVKL